MSKGDDVDFRLTSVLENPDGIDCIGLSRLVQYTSTRLLAIALLHCPCDKTELDARLNARPNTHCTISLQTSYTSPRTAVYAVAPLRISESPASKMDIVLHLKSFPQAVPNSIYMVDCQPRRFTLQGLQEDPFSG